MERVVWFIHKIVNRKKNGGSTALRLSTGVLILAASIWGATFATTNIATAAIARDCTTNAIMNCGAEDAAEFAKKYKANQPKDLEKIYAAYGLNKSELSRFTKNAKAGTVSDTGEIKIGDKIVAGGARSLGRETMPGSTTKTIDGVNYYERPTSVSFNEGTHTLPAMILMNGTKVETVILTSCGNPVTFSYKCDLLQKETVSGKKNTYAFTTKATTQHGATVDKVVYDFGDGSDKVTKNKISDKATHTYTKSGKFTAKVTVYFTVDGKTKTHTSADCTKTVEIKITTAAAVATCKALSAKLVPSTKNKYTFVATARAENGATLTSGDFTFGDGTKKDGVAADGLTVTTEHEYPKTDTHTANVTLHFTTPGNTKKTATCKVSVHPNIAVTTSTTTPKDDEDEPEETAEDDKPAALPETGAGLLGGAVGLSSVAGAGYYWRGSRKGLLQRLRNRL